MNDFVTDSLKEIFETKALSRPQTAMTEKTVVKGDKYTFSTVNKP